MADDPSLVWAERTAKATHPHSRGLGFLSEGIRRALFRDTLGVGRFMKIGNSLAKRASFPRRHSRSFADVLAGLFTRFAAIPLRCANSW
jgi:hypothetical protein